MIVFHCIAWPDDFGLLEALAAPYEPPLDIFRKTCGHTIQIDFSRFHPLWLHKNLMAFFIWKTDYFILNAWAIARPFTLNLSRIDRRKIEVFANDFVRFWICRAYPAGSLFLLDRFCSKGKRKRRFIRKLLNETREINAST